MLPLLWSSMENVAFTMELYGERCLYYGALCRMLPLLWSSMQIYE
jgi:hypothetical protein